MNQPILAVGWDVGGWLGRKQAVAVIEQDGEQRGWRGGPEKFTLDRLMQCGGSVSDLIKIAWDEAPADTMVRYRIVLAIDAPLGLPMPFKAFVSGRQLTSATTPRDIFDQLAYRTTDHHVIKHLGGRPL